MVTIVPRQTWGALPANRTIYKIAASRRTGFVVHHSVSNTGSNATGAKALIRSFQRSHQSNGWGDIGYNFLIDAWGNIYEGRGLNAIGAHAGNHNTLNLGVCYIGDGRTGEMPEPAKQAFRNLYAWANLQTGKTLTRLVHSDLNSTACPGPFIRNWVKAGGLTASSVSPATAPAPAPTPALVPLPLKGDDMTTLTIHHQVNTNGNQAYIAEGAFGFQIVSRDWAVAILKSQNVDLASLKQINEFDFNAMSQAKARDVSKGVSAIAAAVALAIPASAPAAGSGPTVQQIAEATQTILADDFARVNANVDEIPLGFTVTAK